MDRSDAKAMFIGGMGVGKTTNILATYKIFNESWKYRRHGIGFKDESLKIWSKVFLSDTSVPAATMGPKDYYVTFDPRGYGVKNPFLRIKITDSRGGDIQDINDVSAQKKLLFEMNTADYILLVIPCEEMFPTTEDEMGAIRYGVKKIFDLLNECIRYGRKDREVIFVFSKVDRIDGGPILKKRIDDMFRDLRESDRVKVHHLFVACTANSIINPELPILSVIARTLVKEIQQNDSIGYRFFNNAMIMRTKWMLKTLSRMTGDKKWENML